MKMKAVSVITAACLTTLLVFGCEKNEPVAPPALQAQGPAFSAALPAALAGKAMVPGGKVNIDNLNKSKMETTLTIKSEEGFALDGWAFDDKTKAVPDQVFIELAKGGQKYYLAAGRIERVDVNRIFGLDAQKKAGYILNADIKPVPPGEYDINVIQVSGGNPIVAPTGKKINKTN